jgi:hypothetical protein
MAAMKNIFFGFLLLVSILNVVAAEQSSQAEASGEAGTCSSAVDISDRSYLSEALERIKSANQSLDISMYSVAIGTASEDPAFQLIDALKQAAARGVRVRLWLNARQAAIGSTRTFLREDIQESLQKQGLEIFYVDPKFRLHDKLMVIDRKTVIDGSMNWTREALLRNFESVSVIESPVLAEAKIKRLESLPLMKDVLRKAAAVETFPFPLLTLKEAEMFPAALEEKEPRTLALYLALLREKERIGQDSFTFPLEEWSEKLRFKKRLLGWKLQHDMKRHLGFLKERYALLDWQETEKGQIQISLNPVVFEESIAVPRPLVDAGYLKTLSAKTLFVYLIVLYKAQIETNVPIWLGSLDAVAAEFHTNRTTLIQALTELKRANLIEIFPSEKKKVDGRWQREFTNRYLLNPLPTPAERENRFEDLREKFGAGRVAKAVQLADSIDEPEDPEVTRQFVSFLRSYPEREVEKATALVARYSRNNPLRTPAYIRGILEGELAA